MAAPFLKWAGGKGRLAPVVRALVPAAIATYHEPFVGGGAVFFALEAAGGVRAAALNDLNVELAEAYTVVREDVEALIVALSALAARYGPLAHAERARLYYEVRGQQRATPQERVARLVFLNKTCYNGLFRVNRKGQFNVPHGDYVNPRIADPAGLRAASAALQAAVVTSCDFEEACARARPGDFVYLDPPYQPLSATSSFTSYTSAEFGEAAQQRLAEVFRGLTRRGVAAMLSNSAHPFIESLYEGFEQRRVPMGRAINSVGARRGAIDELLVLNYGAPGAGHRAPSGAGEGMGLGTQHPALSPR